MNTSLAPPLPLRASPRRRWLNWLLWLIVFGSGFAAGVGVTLLGVRRGLLESIHHPEAMPGKVAQRLRRPLQLSDDQLRSIEQIIAKRQQVLLRIRVRVQPEVEAELDAIRREIGQVLDDQQRSKWEHLFDHLRRTWLPSLPPQAAVTPAEEP